MRHRLGLFIIIITSFLLLTACTDTSENNSIPALQNDNRNLLNQFLTEGEKIDELYYEEAPLTSYYSGGIKIENISRVWLKGSQLKTEQVSLFYKDDELIEREVTGELYNYASLARTRYYLGQNPDRIKSYPAVQEYDYFVPREKTLLWYLDKIPPDITSLAQSQYEGAACLTVEILKNGSGSTKVWLSTKTGLPIRVVSAYNGDTSEKIYCNFKVGKDSVADEDLKIPQEALIY